MQIHGPYSFRLADIGLVAPLFRPFGLLISNLASGELSLPFDILSELFSVEERLFQLSFGLFFYGFEELFV